MHLMTQGFLKSNKHRQNDTRFSPRLVVFGWVSSALTALLLCCTAPWLKGIGVFMFLKRQLKDKAILGAPLEYFFHLTLAALK